MREKPELENVLKAVEIAYGSSVDKHPEYVKTLPGACNVITEEIGEAAQAINDYCSEGGDQHRAHAIEELLQVAASACRMIIEIDELEAIL